MFDLNMSNSYINQITLDCLLNKETMGKYLMKQREKQINKEELNFYKKRIFNLFKEIISNKLPDDLQPDVKYAYDCFIKSAINYFKTIDNNDLLQEDYKDLVISNDDCNETTIDTTKNIDDANNYLMRSVKMDVPTLDKYVKRVSNKKPENIILPKQREIDIKNPELKNKGIKKNITNIYEDKKESEK